MVLSCVCIPRVQVAFWHCSDVTLWKRHLVIALCIVFLFSPLFELLLVFNSAFHLPFSLDHFSWEVTDLLQCSHIPSAGSWNRSQCCRYVSSWSKTPVLGQHQLYVRTSRTLLFLLTAEVLSETVLWGLALETLLPYCTSSALKCPLEFLQAPTTMVMSLGLLHRIDSLLNFQLCLSVDDVPWLLWRVAADGEQWNHFQSKSSFTCSSSAGFLIWTNPGV